MRMASCRQVHTISSFVCTSVARAANGRAGPGEFQHLYGTLSAAATDVGMSPDCSKLGLGVREISIAAGTGADVMAGSAGAAGQAPNVLHQPPCYPELYLCISVKIYKTWHIPT